jgi:hypothetical protein
MDCKTCSKCKIEKELCLFNVSKKGKFGRDSVCKKCKSEYSRKHRELNSEKYKQNAKKSREKNKDSYKNYVELNREKINENNKKYYYNNKNYFKDYHKRNYDSTKQKERVNNYLKTNSDKVKKSKENWRRNNPSYMAEYKIKRKLIDPLYKLKENIKTRIGDSIRRNGFTKKSKTLIILGCSFEYFKQHLEAQFEPWMSWDNYGLYNGKTNYGWDIDHIIPLSSAKDEEELIRLNHYTNLQPLCGYTNRYIKKNKLI